MKTVKKIIFASITLILSLVVTDLLLNAAALVSPRVNEVLSVVSKYIPDERLGHRPNPAYPDHDKNGFRNPLGPETAHIVALGDSQTYGNGVEANQAWPGILEALSGHSVYNMAFGGWGPVHSLLLWNQAAALKPAIVIEGLYSGNDLYDSYNMVYTRGVLPELKIDNINLADDSLQPEEPRPLNERIWEASNTGKATSRFERFRKPLKPWFTENSKIYGLLWRTKYELARFRNKNKDDEDRWQKGKARAARHPSKFQVFSSQSSKTIFESEYRLTALNLDDPAIRKGQRVALEAIHQLHQLASRDGIRFIVLCNPDERTRIQQASKRNNRFELSNSGTQ